MKTVSFNHNFNTIFGVVDLNGLKGYQMALNEVYMYISEATQWKPENRYIDAVPLLERIEATANDLTRLLQEEQERLEEDLKSMSVIDIVENKYPDLNNHSHLIVKPS